eukprot:SAG11_NODE_8448_length_1014_cov_5.071038_1_plen_107_part_01
MLCRKDDEAGIQTMRTAGFPATESGKRKWKDAVYIKTNGQTKPSIFVNEFGQTKEEFDAECDAYLHFQEISQIEGKEETDIRDAHRTHRDKLYSVMKHKTERQLRQT